MQIDDDDKIAYIEAAMVHESSSNPAILRLSVNPLQGEKQEFGNVGNMQKTYITRTFDFKHKSDLLGIFGMVDHETSSIQTLGVITNECPVRNLLEFERLGGMRHQ